MIDIIFEDEHLVAVNKSPGILVIPALTNIVSKIAGKVYPCHRLDRDTSGIVLFAKDKETEQKMFLQFKQRRVKKKYIALVSGCPREGSGIIDKRVEGIPAITRYRVMAKRAGYSVLEVEPITGRTNQIRIHLKSIGHPVLGERKFAFGKDFKVKFRRTALHAREISFVHPVTGKPIILRAILPEDMKKMI